MDSDYPRYPTAAKWVGIVWIAVGILGIGGLLGQIIVTAPPPNARLNAEQKAAESGQACGMCIAGLIYAMFIFAGSQTVRGKAKGLMGNSVGAIVFSLFLLGVTGASLISVNAARAARPNVDFTPFFLLAAFVGGLGLMMFISGVMGISTNTAYREWYKAETQASRPRRRRRVEDDEDEDSNDDRGRRDEGEGRRTRRDGHDH